MFFSLKSFPRTIHLSLFFFSKLISSLPPPFHFFPFPLLLILRFLLILQQSQQSLLFLLINQHNSSFHLLHLLSFLLFNQITQYILKWFYISPRIKFSLFTTRLYLQIHILHTLLQLWTLYISHLLRYRHPTQILQYLHTKSYLPYRSLHPPPTIHLSLILPKFIIKLTFSLNNISPLQPILQMTRIPQHISLYIPLPLPKIPLQQIPQTNQFIHLTTHTHPLLIHLQYHYSILIILIIQ